MNKKYQITHKTDLCVIGGGMAGLLTAISAARCGSKVVLMQDRPVLGGNASSEIRMWVSGAGTRVRNLQETGIMEEILLENMHRNPDRNFSIWDSILYEKVKAEPNIELLLNCACCEADAADDHINSITGFHSAREMNTPAAWLSGSPAKGGVASSRGLAMFYQAILGYLASSPFAPEVAEWLSTPQCSGQDLTLLQHTAFTCGAMCEPSEFFPYGGFGHAGAGGSHGCCSPANGLSFAYVMRGMELGNLPGSRVRRLLAAL